jgi:PEGA domain
MEPGMRLGSLAVVAIGVLLGTPEFAAAQRFPPRPPPPVSLEVPHPIPPISTSPPPPRDLFQQIPQIPPRDLFQQLATRIPPVGMHSRRGFGYGPFPYVPLGYSYMPSVDAAPMRLPQPVPEGALRFETTPGSAQVYVDGYYVGLVDDFGLEGRALELEAGPHRVEVRESGYATLGFEVNIGVNQTTRYRGDLERVAAPQPLQPPAIRSTPKTTYVIPNCYAGDRPPTPPLPSGCDIKQLQTRN